MKAPTAKELVSFRTRLGLKQSEMAKMMAVNQGTLSRWESGYSDPPVHFRLVLAYLKIKLQIE